MAIYQKIPYILIPLIFLGICKTQIKSVILSTKVDKMGKNNILEIVDEISKFISLSRVAKEYFGKDRTWFHHKLHNDIVNGVKYDLTDDECEILLNAIDDISEKLVTCSHKIKKVIETRKRQRGTYYTNANIFNHPAFVNWLSNTNAKIILEPFAGACNIPRLIGEEYDWKCFDIAPQQNKYKVIKRDTIANFPKGYKVCITNPPYLAKNSASRRELHFPKTKYDDIYKHCVELMLQNCKYVAVIIPETFLQANIFQNRLSCVISISEKVFSDTECPICLALFVPKRQTDFDVWVGDKHVGKYNILKQSNLDEYNNLYNKWVFNEKNGSVGVICIDGKNTKISFVEGNKIDTKIIHSSRATTRISGLPKNIDLKTFIDKCNEELNQYRLATHDIFLTSFKSLHNDGTYRRRIKFQTIRCIMNKVLFEMSIN